MSPTAQRDKAAELAKVCSWEALALARGIRDPWFRAQALSWVVRYTDNNAVSIAREAAESASECDDAYRRSTVRAWEIAALGESGNTDEARSSLISALQESKLATPLCSRAEALTYLLEAAFTIGFDEARLVVRELRGACGEGRHWRCKRAIKNAGLLISGEMSPRTYFW
ncbi:MAG: hypothetical protein DHS20C16_17880 [Phycisphaerae bacterium]|nr:MAG: hypothetical protein DHS20C16_17880 [Phycisphaerae bacterium]